MYLSGIAYVVHMSLCASSCRILESAFRDHANAAQRNALVQEFYAAEFGLFKVCIPAAWLVHPFRIGTFEAN